MSSPTTFPRLLGDVGGTNARFGWQAQADAPITDIHILPCAEHATIEAAMRAYLKLAGKPQPVACAFGIANPVTGDQVRMTNHHWAFSISELQSALGLQQLKVINDFTALALSLPDIPDAHRVPIHNGQPQANAPIALLGAGTGLGVSGLVPSGTPGQWRPLAGEGGHITLAAHTLQEYQIIELIRQRYGHVSAERVLSGQGLVDLYIALRQQQSLPAQSFTAPLVAGARVFVLTADRSVLGFDGATGRKLWTQQRPGEPLVLKQAGVLQAFKNTLLVGLSGRLTGIDPTTGSIRWESAIATPRGTNDMERLVDLVAGVSRVNNVVCARSFQTSVTCLDANKGSNVWTRTSAGHVGLAGSEASVFGVESDSKLTSWSRDSGQVQWQSDALRFRGLTAPAAAEGQLLVGDDLGWVHWLDLRGGQTVARVQADATGIAMAPLRAGKNWVVVSKNGLVQAFRAE